jgi:excisionase family DNA binding protein
MADNGSKKTELSMEEILRSKYLSVPELGRYIGRSKGAIRNLVLRRTIPFHKPGGRLLFNREEIDQWIKQS